MARFFQYEIAAHAGQRDRFKNLEFKKGNFENSLGARQGTLLEIIPVHVKNPPVIKFISFITALSDNYAPEYSQQQPFGRPDPYYIWKSSRRSISLTWSIPSSSETNALDNMNNLSWFLASLYPTYKEADQANSIAASPLFRVRYANLISSPTQDGQGILCTITGVTVTHDTKSGYIAIDPGGYTNSAAAAKQAIKEAGFEANIKHGTVLQVPKTMTISCTLNVIHDHPLGWDASTGEWRGRRSGQNYPYSVGLQRAPGAAAGTPGKPFVPTPGDTASKVAEARASELNR